MNKRYPGNYASLSVLAVLGLLLPGLTVPDTLAQTIDDFAAEPPFANADSTNLSGSISTISAVEPSGLGALYQASYYKSYADAVTGNSISWGGALQAVFIDEAGRFREDNGIKGKLEDPDIDYVVEMFADTSVTPPRTRLRRFQQTGDDASLNPVGSVADLVTLKPVWNAGHRLASISQDDLIIQRSLDGSGYYAEDAANKRFIFTYLDALGQGTTGEVDPGEVYDFIPQTFDPDANANWRYLGLADQTDATNLVKYIRGQDVTGWRSRLINLPGDETDLERYWILGDIVNSAPLVVNAPQEAYDRIYGDTTYKDFKTQYAHRRQMIYVGANDGMLHAFNGGIWNAAQRSFQTAGSADAGQVKQEHQLGAEMWAYVPMNLLPHLQWLKSVDYPHAYFVDGAPQSFDVNIFADDATHPGGWGTILVAGMRFGGGTFDLDLDADGNFETTRTSAAIVMDITDPEKTPTLLAELTFAGLGFTTSAPTVIKARRPDSAGSYSSPSVNKWLLVFGSGPNDLATATSITQRPTLFAWDLRTRTSVDLALNLSAPDMEPAGFYGSLASVDQNNDYIDDAVYAGTVEGTEHALTGRLKRLSLNAAAPAFGLANGSAQLSTLLDAGRPIVARSAFIHSYAKNENWLLFGTGRSFTVNDYLSASEQRLFGVKDSGAANSATELSSLVDATNIIVQTDALSGAELVWDSQPDSALLIDDVKLGTFDDLFAFMDNKAGWYKKLRIEQSAERVVTDARFLRSSAIFTSYLPAPTGDQKSGESFVHAVNYRTGTSDATAFLGKDLAGRVRDSVSAGEAELAAPVVYVVQGSDSVSAGTASAPSAVETGSITKLVMGPEDGRQINIDLDLPQSAFRQMSWELMELSF